MRDAPTGAASKRDTSPRDTSPRDTSPRDTPPGERLLHRLLVSLYRLMLVLFLPRTLRDAHGTEMTALYSDALHDAMHNATHNTTHNASGGYWPMCLAGIRGLLDVASRAPHEHWRRSGPVHTQLKEHPVQSLLIDVRQAVRSFTRQRSATLLILGTLTLAVAANLIVFALLDGVFRRPLPFPESDRLVYLNERAPKWNLEYTNINYPDYVAWRERANAFESMTLFASANVNVGAGAATERVKGMLVTHEFASTLGVKPVLGRMFNATEDVPQGVRVVVIGESYWKNQFNSDRDIVGRTLSVNGTLHTIVGVLPAKAAFPTETQLWLPLAGDPNAQGQSYSYDGIGRLKAGVSLSQAEQSLFDAHAPVWLARDTARVVSPRVEPLRDRLVTDFKPAGAALGITAALVFCIACANVAGTMLARSIARRGEIGIRVALGASGSRIVRLLLTESLLLSAVAGVLGTLLAVSVIGPLTRVDGVVLPTWALPEIGTAAIVFSIGLVAVSALVFGLAPALQLRRHVAASHAGGTARTAGSVPERRLLSALVVSEVALAATLLICGGLLAKSYAGLRDADPGFRTEGVVTFRMSLPDTYTHALQQLPVYERVLARLRALPQVDHVGAVTCLPLTCHNGNFFTAEHAAPNSGNAPDPVTNVRTATPDYFDAMHIVLTSGRFFRDGEGGSEGLNRVAVVNEQLAEHLWPDADAVGQRFSFRGDTSRRFITVVGVVRDVRHYGLVRPMIPGLYFPPTVLDSSDNIGSLGFAIHASIGADVLLPLVRSAVREVVPDVPLFELRTMQSALDQSMVQQRLVTLSLVVFAAVALALAMGGIYAVLSYVVSRRRREIAIRMAVGAESAQVLRLILRQGWTLTILGLAIGVPLAAVGARGLSALLVGVSPADVPTYVLAAVMLLVVGSMAAAIPALRASRLEPKAVLSE